jgi:UDP-N-acetylmuramyl pentapeptide phosphotransferase/UDP-N-acetylglucosamine-1-phosphate transferase
MISSELSFFSYINSALGQAVLALITSLFVSLLATPVVIKIARDKQLMDKPNERSSHSSATPRLGGLAIFISVIISFTIWGNFLKIGGLQYILSATALLFFMGLKDDMIGTSNISKLLVQILSALILVFGADLHIGSLFGLFGIFQINEYLSVLLTTFVIVVIINSYNLIDGIDGLAAGIAIIASLAFGIWFFRVGWYSMCVLSVCLVGALIGFLRFNLSKTDKIFMGDAGSLLVGLIIAVFTVKFIQMNETPHDGGIYVKNAPIMAISVLIVPLFDTLRVFLLRALEGHSPFHADRRHIHHILIDKGFTHFRASIILYAATLVSAILVYLLFANTHITPTTIVATTLFGIYTYIFRKPENKTNDTP